MLSRTAESLYWASRYVERAETTARLVEVGYRMSMIPAVGGGHTNEWASILASAGVSQAFRATGKQPDEAAVVDFMFFDRSNPSSIRSCIQGARENIRGARPALTSEVWETLNHAYLHFQEIERRGARGPGIQKTADWMKRHAAALRGAFEMTQLQNEGYDFFNLGHYIERADNTARMLDVKYFVLLPTIETVGGGIDQMQWSTLLRAMSARRSFHWAYSGDYTHQKIAHFLICNLMNPRSLLHCVQETEAHLSRLSRKLGTRTPANSYASAMLGELAETEVSDIIADGLHEFLLGFIRQNRGLNDRIAASFLFGA